MSVIIWGQILLCILLSLILSKRYKLKLLEIFIYLLISLLSIYIYAIFNILGIIIIIPMIMSARYYYSDNKVEAIGTVTYGYLISIIGDHLASLFRSYFWPESQINILPHFILFAVISLIITSIATYIKVIIEKQIEITNFFKRIVVSIGLFTLIINYLAIFLGIFLGNTIELIQLNLFFFAIYGVATIIILVFYLQTLKEKFEVKRRKYEFEALQQYTSSIEKNYNELRQFRHDYNNILLSFEDYFREKKYEELESYFYNQVQPESNVWLKDAFDLNSLSKIKNRPVKSLLIAKLVQAQQEDISIKIEISDDITDISIKNIDLVRLLGIILDNSIEELKELNNRELVISAFTLNESIHFVIKNICRFNVPSLQKLKRKGFTTKKEGKGLGLHIISKMVSEYPNLFLETENNDNVFVQHLIITKEINS